MDKYSDDQFTVSKQEGKLKLRLPGGQVIDYDNRFPDLPHLNEGESTVIANTE